MNAAARLAAASCAAAATLLLFQPPECGAQPLDRKTIVGRRNAMIDWAIRNGVLLKGMTKTEVHKVYGFPDKKFTSMTVTGPVEKWSYYYPRPRNIFPFKRSPFASRYRYLYFRDDILVNFEM